VGRGKFIITMPEPETSDKNEFPSTACAKPCAAPVSRARPASPTLDLSDPPQAAQADRNLAAENAEVEAILDAWARSPPTPPASRELRSRIKRARSTSDARDSPTP